MPDLSAYLDELRAQGALHSGGEFSIDQAQAFQKLRRYQMVEAHYYVLPLVASAVAAGASHIELAGDAFNCTLSHDGRCPLFEDLTTLFSSLLIAQSDRSKSTIRELATGLNAAMSLHPKLLTVVSWDGDRGARLRVDGRFLTVERIEHNPWPEREPMELFGTEDRPEWRTVIEVIGRARDVVEVALVKMGSSPPEWDIVNQRCGFAPVPILINGNRVNPPCPMGTPVVISRLTSEEMPGLPLDHRPAQLLRELPSPGPYQAWLGVYPSQTTSRGTFVIHGISFELELPDLLPGIRAVVVAPDLQKDLSHAGVVHNAEFQSVVDTLDHEAEAMYELLAERQQELEGWSCLELTQFLDQVALRQTRRGDAPRAAALYQRIRDIRERGVHPRSAARRFELWANLYESQGNLAEAAYYKEKARSFPKSLGQPDPPVEACPDLGRPDAALESQQPAAANLKEILLKALSDVPPLVIKAVVALILAWLLMMFLPLLL